MLWLKYIIKIFFIQQFNYRQLQKALEPVPSMKQVLPAETQKEYERFVRTPFHMPCPARYSVLHLLGVLSGGNEPPLCKGRWLS